MNMRSGWVISAENGKDVRSCTESELTCGYMAYGIVNWALLLWNRQSEAGSCITKTWRSIDASQPLTTLTKTNYSGVYLRGFCFTNYFQS